MFGLPPESEIDVCQIEYAEWSKQAMSSSFETAKLHLTDATKRQKTYYDQKAKLSAFEIGSFVWRSELFYQVQRSPTKPVISVNVDHLEQYLGNNAPESWNNGNDGSITIELPEVEDLPFLENTVLEYPESYDNYPTTPLPFVPNDEEP
ncbi:hypothetical protein MAR_031767 [Mya arenaria]|uniref:Uncharacterized protein n=1 Tax=Mya arenaria TaxID=6604 RepID=A0ABY7F4Q6_MYAAR|nr:hypothetical protein MAR_031767 [Mya arenaria]